MQKRRLLMLSAFSLSLLLSSCNELKELDFPVCTEISPIRGWCLYTISKIEFYWDEDHKFEDKTWWEAKPTMVYIPVSSYVKLKSFVIKHCRKHEKECREIATWDRKINSIDEKVQSKGK